jgi:hypothetical protein
MMAERTTLPVDLGSGPLLQVDGYHLMTELGRVRMALIPGVLAGTYVVAPFGGRGFMSLGVQLDAADFQLALVEGVTWKRTELGRVPHYLPFRQVMPRGHESEATYREYVEFPVPGQGLLTWCAQDHRHHRREGTYVVGWPGVHRTTAGDQAVFIKVIKEPEGLAYILENERHLRRAASRNPALAAFAPLANVVWTQGVGEIASRIPGGRPGCAVVIERLITGPTLADLASGLARLEPAGGERPETGGSERPTPARSPPAGGWRAKGSSSSTAMRPAASACSRPMRPRATTSCARASPSTRSAKRCPRRWSAPIAITTWPSRTRAGACAAPCSIPMCARSGG